MSHASEHESAKAAGEARDAIVTRPSGSKSSAITEAMRRYLGAATYDELRKSQAEKAEDEGSPRAGQ